MKLEELNKMFNDFGKYMVSQSQKNLKDLGKGGGPLENSITYDVDDKQKGKVIFEFLMQDYGEFQGSAKGKWKDFVRSIAAWAQIKNIRLRQYTYKDGKKKSTGKFAKGNYQSIGYVIASNIYNRGLKPSFFYTKPFNKAFENLPDELFESFAVDIEHGIIEEINKK